MEYVRELDTRAAGTAATQSALKVHRLTFMEAAMLVVGSTIGSGVLGLAYASRLAGWPVPFVWLVVAGIFPVFPCCMSRKQPCGHKSRCSFPAWLKSTWGESVPG